jgi:hypothetical protein
VRAVVPEQSIAPPCSEVCLQCCTRDSRCCPHARDGCREYFQTQQTMCAFSTTSTSPPCDPTTSFYLPSSAAIDDSRATPHRHHSHRHSHTSRQPNTNMGHSSRHPSIIRVVSMAQHSGLVPDASAGHTHSPHKPLLVMDVHSDRI